MLPRQPGADRADAFVEFARAEIEQSIPARFEQQVARYPDRLAVKTRTHRLSYAQLNRAANHMARAVLARRGAGEEPIALLLDNDAPMIAAMLGVLKVGKFYVPLDPSLPRARLSYMLEDSGAALVLTDGRFVSLARELARPTRQLLEVDKLEAGLPDEDVRLPISPDAFAWILYTSGSTGQPKGVIQNHRNVLHFVMNYTNQFHLCPDDRLTLLYSLSVMAAAYAMFSALLTGASLHPLNIRQEGVGRLASWLIRERITYYSSVPTVFRHFAAGLTGEEMFPHLRLLRLEGEQVLSRDLELYKRHFSDDCEFVNRLGSTETGTIRWYVADKNTQVDGHAVPVGYPVEGKEVLLLDEAGEEVGPDAVGEIAVRSRYLSPGYWRRPDLTAATFAPDPRGGDERIYRTGDLGRMLPDGCLVHVGRKDAQVKIRGHRIEVGEIELAVRDIAGIEDAVVAARDDGSGELRLVAYVVPSAKPRPTVSELRDHLRARLPEYMLPSTFVALDALPVAPNGKVDRRALPAPDGARPELATPFIAPRTSAEELLAGLWAEILGLERVGVHDDFLALGGDSLLATRLASRIRDTLQLDLSLPLLLKAPTVAEQATAILVDALAGRTGTHVTP